MRKPIEYAAQKALEAVNAAAHYDTDRVQALLAAIMRIEHDSHLGMLCETIIAAQLYPQNLRDSDLEAAETACDDIRKWADKLADEIDATNRGYQEDAA